MKIMETKRESLEKKKERDRQSTRFLLTLNNPLTYGYAHDEIRRIIHEHFKHVSFYCMSDEVSDTGTPHTHVFILLGSKKRWSAVQNAFAHGHIEAMVKGTTEQVVAYIKKEKGSTKQHTRVPGTYEEWGSIPVILPNASKNEILLQGQALLDQGLTPSEICGRSILFRQCEGEIKKSFFAAKLMATPAQREIDVYWHVGPTGSGKSYTYVKLCKRHGDEEVFFTSNYRNNCTALMEGYEAQKYLVLDEMKAGCIPYGFLLGLLDGYKRPIYARYNNVYALFEQVHITSVFTPDEIYKSIVGPENREVDSLDQLMGRIKVVIFHWKYGEEYKSYGILGKKYTSREDLQRRALRRTKGFLSASGGTPFGQPTP